VIMKFRSVARATLTGGLLGSLLGLVGPPVYFFVIFEGLMIIGIVRCSTCDFGEAFFLLLYGIAPALSIGSDILITASAISGANGAVAGLVVSIIASSNLPRPLVTSATICGLIAVVPAAIYQITSPGQDMSNNIIFVYAPAILYVCAMALIGVGLYQYVAGRTQSV